MDRRLFIGMGALLIGLFALSVWGMGSHSSSALNVPLNTSLDLYSKEIQSPILFDPAPGSSCYIKVRVYVLHAGTKIPTNPDLKSLWSADGKKTVMTAAIADIQANRLKEMFASVPVLPPQFVLDGTINVVTDPQQIKKMGFLLKDALPLTNNVVTSPPNFFTLQPDFNDTIIRFSDSEVGTLNAVVHNANQVAGKDTISVIVVDNFEGGITGKMGVTYYQNGVIFLNYKVFMDYYLSWKQAGKPYQLFTHNFVHELGHAHALDHAGTGFQQNVMCDKDNQSTDPNKKCKAGFELTKNQALSLKAHAQGSCVEQGSYFPEKAGAWVTGDVPNYQCGNKATGTDEECEMIWVDKFEPNKVITTKKFPDMRYCMIVDETKKILISVNSTNVNTLKANPAYKEKIKVCNTQTCTCEKPTTTTGSSTTSHQIVVGTPKHYYTVDVTPNPGASPTPGTPGGTPHFPPVITPPSCAAINKDDPCAGAFFCYVDGTCVDENDQYVCTCDENGCFAPPVCPSDGYCPKTHDADGQLIDQVCQTIDDSCGCAPAVRAESTGEEESDTEEVDPPETNPDDPPF